MYRDMYIDAHIVNGYMYQHTYMYTYSQRCTYVYTYMCIHVYIYRDLGINV